MADLTFVDYSSSYIMQKQLAEMYERIYPWGAEDFVNWKDFDIRDKGLNTWMTTLVTDLKLLNLYIQTHTHTSATPGSPTSPPIVPLLIQYPPPPPVTINLTGSSSNLTGNMNIAWEYLSYIDLTTTGTNQPISVFRRALAIPINTAVITPPLTKT